MINWISANEELLNLTANWVMVAIWVAYLQVFLLSFRRQTLPKLVINRAAGSSLDASCFVSNMSSEAIYVESVIVEIEAGDDKIACTVTDFAIGQSQDDPSDPKLQTYQGVLPSAQYTSLGRFGDLISMWPIARDTIMTASRLPATRSLSRLRLSRTMHPNGCWSAPSANSKRVGRMTTGN